MPPAAELKSRRRFLQATGFLTANFILSSCITINVGPPPADTPTAVPKPTDVPKPTEAPASQATRDEPKLPTVEPAKPSATPEPTLTPAPVLPEVKVTPVSREKVEQSLWREETTYPEFPKDLGPISPYFIQDGII